MKKTLALIALSFAFNGFASNSCSLFFSTEKLNLSSVEQAKLELFLKKKNYTLNQMNFNPFALQKYFLIEGVVEAHGEGKKPYTVSRVQIKTESGQINGFNFQKTKAEKIEEAADLKDIELVLRKGQGMGSEIVKVLKPKKKFLSGDKGSDGFVLAMGVARDLPKCKTDKKLAIDNSDRGFNPYGMGGGYMGMGYPGGGMVGGSMGGGFNMGGFGSSGVGY